MKRFINEFAYSEIFFGGCLATLLIIGVVNL
jgi:hypothetical protein